MAILIQTLNTGIGGGGGGATAVQQITVADALNLNSTNGWTDGGLYQITDPGSSFATNLLYYRAQAYPDPVSGEVRLSTVGYGRLTNSNGVSNEGIVGFDFADNSGNGELYFFDPLTLNEVYDVLVLGTNGADVYNPLQWQNASWIVGQLDTAQIPSSALNLFGVKLGGATVSDGAPFNISSTVAATSIIISQSNIRGGNNINFTLASQSILEMNTGVGNNIYLPKSSSVYGWTLAAGGSYFDAVNQPAICNYLTSGHQCTITVSNPAITTSYCTFSNNQTYQFTYSIDNCNFGKGYVEYKAFLSQSGSAAPTASIILNEVNGVSYTRISNGHYTYSVGTGTTPYFAFINAGSTADSWPGNGIICGCNANNEIFVGDGGGGLDDELAEAPFILQIPI